MTGLPILLSRKKASFIPIEGDNHLVANYFQSTQRAVHALFDKRGLKDLGNDAYSYLAKPIPVVCWEVNPFLLFHIEQPSRQHQVDVDLRLILDSCELGGDKHWSVIAKNITFDCQAAFTSSSGGFQASAAAVATVHCNGWLAMMPAVVIRELAVPVIDWVLNRLMLRCEKSLRKDVESSLLQLSSVVS